MAEDYDLPEQLLTEALVRDLNAGKVVASEVGATIPGIDADKQPQFLLELVQAYGRGALQLDAFFQAIGAAGLTGDVSSDLMEAIWLTWLQPGVKQEELGELAKECVKKDKLTRRVVMELGEPELIVAAGQAPTKVGLDARERKVFTATFYKQDKYNLLREENEGYSKLLSLLLSGGSLQQQHVAALTRDIKALIGAFKLDPNRVCELLLEAAERDEAGVGHWLGLLELFNEKAPMEMLAMKFLHYQQDHSHLAAGEDDPASSKQQQQQGKPPASLYNLAAAMIKAGHVSLEGVLAYIAPSADAMAAAYKANLEALTDDVKQLGLVKLGDGGKEAPAAAAGGRAAALLADDVKQLGLVKLGDGGKEAPAAAAGGRAAALLAGNLDAIASERGITNDVKDDAYAAPGRGRGIPGSGMPLNPAAAAFMPPGPMGLQQQQQQQQQGMLPPSGMWGARGMPPQQQQQQMGGGGGMGGPGGYGGMQQQQQGGMQGNGAMMGMGGGQMQPMQGGMRGGMGGPMMMGAAAAAGGAVGGSAARGGAGGAGYSASYSVMPAAQLELDAHSMDRPLLDGSAGHLQLLAALMKAGDWQHALLLLDFMQGVLSVQAANDIAISTAMLAHLKRLLEPCYKALYPKGPLGGNILHKTPYNLGPKGFASSGFRGDSQNPALSAEALTPRGPELEPLGFKLLEHAGAYVYRDPEVMVMLLRVLQHELLFYGGLAPQEWQHQQQQVNTDKVAQVCKVLAEVALPALSLSQANRGLAHELWAVMQLLPFHDRAEVYRQGLAACNSCPPAAAAGQMAVKAFKKIKARLALPDKADKGRKDVVRANANLLSKVSHSTPLQVADQVLWQAASFPNAVEPLAEVLKLPNPLTMDALTYMALYWWGRLGRAKMKEDGANEEDWVSGVADLVGIACCSSKHNFKLQTLLPYVFDELRGGDTLAVLLLRSILRKMTGVDGPANVDPSQASLLCCGTVMQAEAIHSVANREEPAFQMGRSTLLKVLTEGSPDQQLLVPLAVVMAQHLDWSLFTLHTQHLKELAEQHDRVNEICQQYIMMLEHCVLKDQEMELKDYAAALPPLHVLIRQYGVHPGIAWMLWRPVVAALEPQLMARLEARALAAAAAAGEEGEEGEAEALPDAAAAAAADGSSKAPAAAADGEEGELPEEGEAMQGAEGPGAARAGAAAAAAAAAAAESAAKLALPVSLADVEGSVGQIDEALFKTLREPLYIAFWSLRPEEMHVPTDIYDTRIGEMEAFLRTSGKEASQLQNSIDSEKRGLERLQTAPVHGRGGPRVGFRVTFQGFVCEVWDPGVSLKSDSEKRGLERLQTAPVHGRGGPRVGFRVTFQGFVCEVWDPGVSLKSDSEKRGLERLQTAPVHGRGGPRVGLRGEV
uniref:Uncharacterized protein n=1 Tax=Tetradesmus obliquus TaxID=3088 RepID=A0A383V3G1_TETOB|eukprot:jgi/Sobl393_1/4564/SZX59450.1